MMSDFNHSAFFFKSIVKLYHVVPSSELTTFVYFLWKDSFQRNIFFTFIQLCAFVNALYDWILIPPICIPENAPSSKLCLSNLLPEDFMLRIQGPKLLNDKQFDQTQNIIFCICCKGVNFSQQKLIMILLVYSLLSHVPHAIYTWTLRGLSVYYWIGRVKALSHQVASQRRVHGVVKFMESP